MDLEEQAERLAKYVAAELKGQIVTRGSSGLAVARETGHHSPTVSNWLNGKREIPISFAYKACAAIGVDLARVVQLADERLNAEIAAMERTAAAASAAAVVPGGDDDDQATQCGPSEDDGYDTDYDDRARPLTEDEIPHLGTINLDGLALAAHSEDGVEVEQEQSQEHP